MNSHYYINRPANAAVDPAQLPTERQAAYRAVMDPEAVARAVMDNPAAASAARSFGDGGKRVLELATEAVHRLEPVAIKLLDAFDKWQSFSNKGFRTASTVSYYVLRAVFGIAITVVVAALRITAPLTTRAAGYSAKVIIPAIIAEMGLLPAFAPLLALSDPRAKERVRPAGDAAGYAMFDIPVYLYHYKDGAAVPEDMLEHLGVMADDLYRLAKIGSGLRNPATGVMEVPIADVVAATILALQICRRREDHLQEQIDALRKLVEERQTRNI